MEFWDISAHRLESQQLSGSKFKTAAALVSHFGAMQAQDLPMAKWAVGARLPHLSEADVDKAIDSGKVLRTHVLRPTWHLVSPDAVSWMIDLSAPNIRRLMKTNDRKLGLDDAVYHKCNDILQRAISDHGHLTRAEIVETLNAHKINTSDYRSGHILIAAELEKLITSGKSKNGQPTYALFSDRVKKEENIGREEALAKLAETYFTSHGPATLADFTWWAGLNLTDSRMAIASVEKKFGKAEINGSVYYFKNRKSPESSENALLLPAFDEFLIAYKDRSASLDPQHHKHAFTVNGIFWPILVADGQGVGTWKRTIKKDTVEISMQFLEKIPETKKAELYEMAEGFAKFLGKKLVA